MFQKSIQTYTEQDNSNLTEIKGKNRGRISSFIFLRSYISQENEPLHHKYLTLLICE